MPPLHVDKHHDVYLLEKKPEKATKEHRGNKACDLLPEVTHSPTVLLNRSFWPGHKS